MGLHPRKPWYYALHSVLGLYLSVFLGFVCLTGTVATVSQEIEWLLLPQTRGDRTGEMVSLGRQFDAALAAYPGMTPQSVGHKGTEAGMEGYLATAVSGSDRAGRHLAVYVNPADGRVQGHWSGVAFDSFMRGLHYYLFDPGEVMFYAVTLLGPVLLIMGVTGLFYYRKWWKGFLKVPARDAKPRVWWGQLHRWLGIWSLPFVLVIGITGFWYMFEYQLKWEGPYPELEKPMTPRASEWTGADIDRWVAIAQRELPGLEPVNVYLPWDAGSPVQVSGRRGDLLVRGRANRISIHPDNDSVVQVQRADRMGILERWVHTADPLHFGDFAGLTSKLIWFVLGFALTALSLSGAVVFARRTALVLGKPPQVADTPVREGAPC